MKLEDEVQQLIRLEAPRVNTSLFRNNSGAFTDSTGRTVRFGLGNDSSKLSADFKSSDLIGITQVLIAPDMVGKTVGVFTAIEVKKEDWVFKAYDKRAQAQKNFIDFVQSRGGLAGFANCVESFRQIIRK